MYGESIHFFKEFFIYQITNCSSYRPSYEFVCIDIATYTFVFVSYLNLIHHAIALISHVINVTIHVPIYLMPVIENTLNAVSTTK